MTSVQSSDETRPEKECFDRVLAAALVLPEVKIALGRFPQRGATELAQAVEAERADIWRRVSRARHRVRQLDAYRAEIERRIAETAPQVVGWSLSLEREYLRLVTIWNTISREAERLGIDIEGLSPARELQDIRHELDEAKHGNSCVPEISASPESRSGSEPASHAAGRLNPRHPVSGRIGSRLASYVLTPFGLAKDQRERARQAVIRLKSDIDRLRTALQELAPAISRLAILTAEKDPEYVTTTAELHEAWQRLEDGLLNDGVLDTLRRTLNNYLEDLYTIRMPFLAAPALGDPVVLDRPVETSALREVRNLIDRMRGASIGVAGPRGAGKSTLIDAFCSGTTARSSDDSASSMQAESRTPRQWLGLRVTAPVDYAPRDFILYLFAELCRRVAGRQAESTIEPDPDLSDPAAKLSLRMVLAASVVAGAVGATCGGVLVAYALRKQPSLIHQVSTLLGAILLLLGGAVMVCGRPSKSEGRLYLTAVPSPGRRPILRRSLGLGLLAVAGVLALLAGQLSPARPPAYLSGVAAIAVAGLIVLTEAAFTDGSEMIFIRSASPPGPGPGRPDPRLRLVMAVLITGAAIACGAFGAAAVAVALVTSGWSLPLLAGMALILVGGGMLCVPLSLPGSGLSDPVPPPASRRPPEDGNGQEWLSDFAVANLLAIRFQRTFSSSWSGTVGVSAGQLPINIESRRSRGASWARQPQTYPELVGRLREFIASLTRYYSVVLGIDELDKLESGVKAEQFLNDIKGIFGIRECYFLVSVSEDAVANFEGRGVPFRDVFDSCFDNVISVSYLDLASAKQLLYGRVIGWPAPFIALCYVLSGGLARDLLRAARAVMRDSAGEIRLADAARDLCREEAKARTHGLQHQLVRSVGDGPSDELLGLLADMSNETGESASAATYSVRSAELSRWAAATARSADLGDGRPAGEPDACRWARDLSAWYLFLATILEFFTSELRRDRMETAEDPQAGARSLDHLAAARQAMSVNTRVAVRHIEEFRAGWELGHPQRRPGPASGDPRPGAIPAARADSDDSEPAPGRGLA